MPHYYFHVMDGQENGDPDSVELADLDAAQTMAVRYVADLLRENMLPFLNLGTLSLTVTDDSHRTLFDLALTVRQTVQEQRHLAIVA